MPKRPERRKRRIPVDLLINKYIDGEPHVCRAVNVSSGGVLLYKVFEPDVVQEEVSLEFQLPGSARVLRADGVTLSEHRWARAHGVRFTRIAEEDRVLLDAFLRGELRDDAVAM